MFDLADHPVSRRWPAENPNILQLYSFPTPNGVKAAIALEELGLDYEPHRITLSDADVKSPEYLALNPNNKIPAIIDPDGPGGQPMALFESGAILIYLAEKAGGRLLGEGAARYQVIQWLMFQMGGIGPMFGQVGYFVKFKGREIEDPRPRERYVTEARRLLNVVNGELKSRDWISGDYSIADIAIAPWIRNLERYEALDLVGWDDFPALHAYLKRFLERPAVQRGLNIPPREV
ncbi:MAG: glutathione S-transferase N-terminal domain-containing protein [Pseudomonadota bacterium]